MSSSTTPVPTVMDHQSSSIYPIWLDDSHLDPLWIKNKTGLACTDCRVVDVSNQTRQGNKPKDGATLRLTLTLEDNDDPLTLIVKQVPEQGRALSRRLGLAREALFYRDFSRMLPEHSVPTIYYAAGDMETGAKCIIMQDLSTVAVDSAVFFGPGNPNSWNKNLESEVARATGGKHNITAAQVAETTFVAMARIHAQFWKRNDLLSSSNDDWLRGQAWLQGKGKESWEASQGMISTIWKKTTGNLDTAIQWDPLLKKITNKAVQGISWEAQTQRLHPDGEWTLVHGDFWPGNCMWMFEDNSIRLLDWEMCGIGSGPQDLGQYILSNMEPSERRACERHLIKVYHQELANAGVKVSWEYCWKEYTIGGLERWLWFLVYFLGQPGFQDWAQFFHNQMASFVHDHGITEADIVQVRP